LTSQICKTPVPAREDLGSRFVLDSWLLGELVYDRLVVDGQMVPRSLPSSLDVLAALGNPRALHHLQSEFARYGYRENLQALCDALAGQEDAVWQSSLYHQLLYALRTLHTETRTNSDEQYPPALRGAAWADKMLHTQLAAWAQLRHDNILYVKEPYTDLLPWREKYSTPGASPACIADAHTCPPSELFPPDSAGVDEKFSLVRPSVAPAPGTAPYLDIPAARVKRAVAPGCLEAHHRAMRWCH
jgi:Protein of unknown function (DUF3160)